MGAIVIDNKKYARVLAKVLPRVITTDEEHERMLAEAEKLMDKGEHRSAEEDAALDLMVRLIKDYEVEHYPLDRSEPSRNVGVSDGAAEFEASRPSSDFQIQRLRIRRTQRETRHQQSTRQAACRIFQGLGGPVHLNSSAFRFYQRRRRRFGNSAKVARRKLCVLDDADPIPGANLVCNRAGRGRSEAGRHSLSRSIQCSPSGEYTYGLGSVTGSRIAV
jgi:hypothetical protein